MPSATPATTAAALTNETIRTLDIRKEMLIHASPNIAFEALLEELGPGGQSPDGKDYPFVLEPWPGGRWFRDLGETGGHKYGHLWGHVQVIKAPTLVEIRGPFWMSYPAINFLQYRLTAESAGTRISLTHRAMGLMPEDLRDGVNQGWEFKLARVVTIAERKAKAASGR
jgi:hypothetical protein